MSAPLSPIALYTRLTEASAALGRQIFLLDTQDQELASPVASVWVHLDDPVSSTGQALIERLPAALAWEAHRQIEEGA